MVEDNHQPRKLQKPSGTNSSDYDSMIPKTD